MAAKIHNLIVTPVSILSILIFMGVWSCSCDRGIVPETGVNGKPLNETVGITHTGASYTMNSNMDFLQEGALQVDRLGSKVIKLWFADTATMQWCYPYNIKWGELGIKNSVDMAKCEYFDRVFRMDFRTYILETMTFDAGQSDYSVVWTDGMTGDECRRIENEAYLLAKYFMTEFNGTGKEFVIQNWEGDNMLMNFKWRYNAEKKLYYKADAGQDSSNEKDDREFRIKLEGLTHWFNYRQKGIDKARAEMEGKTDVSVRHALEMSFTYLNSEDDGWAYSDTPLVMDKVIQFTDCDLYSYSSWMTHTIKRAHELKTRLQMINDRLGDTYVDIYDGYKVKPRRPFTRKGQKSRMMLGEFGAIEGMQYADSLKWGVGFTDETSRRQREVLQIQTELSENLGLEFIVFWELYCNVYRGDLLDEHINMSKGDQIRKNEHLQGNWLIRVDGTCTEAYKYLRGICNPEEALYCNGKFQDNRVYRIDDEYAGFEITAKTSLSYVPVNIRDRKDFEKHIEFYASFDGEVFNRISLECFFTDYEICGDKVIADIKYINADPGNSEYRYFKAVTKTGKDGILLNPEGIKFYRPNPIIDKQ